MNLNEKKLLILGANPETAGTVIKANALGVKTYVTDYTPNAYAKRYANVPLNIDATDVDSLEKVICDEKIDGVLCGVAEALMPTYARICSDLKLPCYGDEKLFKLFVDKANFKNTCREYNVPVVEEFCLEKYDREALETVKLPVVVKPVDACSSKGISVCRNIEELQSGINKALSFSKSKRLLIEKYMTGEEVIVYYAFQDGEPSLIAMCDRYTNREQEGVAQLPTSYIFPSKHLNKYIEEVDPKVKEMFASLGVKNGFMFIQSFIDEDGGVRFYEPGYRLNGAQEHYLVDATTGIDAKTCLINLALTGKEADYIISDKADPKMHGYVACKLSPLVKCGVIKEIQGLSEIEKLKGVVSINPSYDDGDEVSGYGTLRQIICRFFIVAENPSELKSIIEEIYRKFEVIGEDGESMLMTRFGTHVLYDYE